MTSAAIEDEAHALYRFYDEADRLLYVGITANPGRRFGEHSSSKPWWHEVVHIRMEHHPTRNAVLAAERVAIQREQPLHNIIHANSSAGSYDPSKPYVACPACSQGSILDRSTDRYFHVDGSGNDQCWRAVSSGRADGRLTPPSRVELGGGDEWPVGIGDVVALGLSNRECPVGLVDRVSAFGPRLALLSFGDGTFGHAHQTVKWQSVEEIRHARLKQDDEMSDFERRRTGLSKIFHTDPLGDFQVLWREGRDAMLEHRRTRRVQCDA